MVTYRQVGRDLGRTLKAMDREARRLERQRIVVEKARQRQGLLEASSNAAQQYDDTIAALTGAHHRDALCSSAVGIALECLRVLPIDAAEVVMQTDLLDPGW